MKFLPVLLVMMSPLAVAEVDGTPWYDASGELVMVEGPAAEPAPQPFVPEWRKREIERRERRGAGSRGFYYGDPGWYRGAWYGGFVSRSCHRPRRCYPRAVPYRGGRFRSFCGYRGSGVSIIIRR